MHDHYPGGPRRAALSLLLLLYVGVVASAPLLHAYDPHGDLFATEQERGGEERSPLPHADFDCILCHAAGPALGAGSFAGLDEPDSDAPRVVVSADTPPLLPLVLSPRPRGPPRSPATLS